MSSIAVIFLVFSVGFSWFAGDKKNDQLKDRLEETAYEQKTMVEQVRQSKLKASFDAKKMTELSNKVSKLSKEKEKVERKLGRSKLRRGRLLRPQIIKIKEKVEAPYKRKIVKMEKEVKTAKANLAKLKAENDKLKRQYRELIRKNKERISGFDNSNRTPVSKGLGLEKEPLSKDGGLERAPLTSDDGLERAPLTKEDGLEKVPLTKDRGLEREPLTKDRGLDKKPLTKEDGLDKEPLTKEDGLDKEPLTREDGLDREPLTKEDSLDKEPLTRDDALDDTPLTKEDLIPTIPVEELVELDNGLLVKLDNTDGRDRIPASRDLVSAEEILRSEDGLDELSDYIRVEQVNTKEGWL